MKIMGYGFFLTLLLIIVSGWTDTSIDLPVLGTVFSILSAILSLGLGIFSIVLSVGGKHILRKVNNFYLKKMFGVNLPLSLVVDRDYNELMILAYLVNFYKENMVEYESENEMYFPAIQCDVSHPKFRTLQRLAEDWFVTDVTWIFKNQYEEMLQTPPSGKKYPEARYFHINDEFAKLISPHSKLIRYPIEAYDGKSLPFGYEKYFVIL